MNIIKKLTEWEEAGLITNHQTQSIRTYEAAQPSATHFIWRHGLLGIGLLIIAIGLIAIVASHWSAIPVSVKFATHLVFNLSLAGYLFYLWSKNNHPTPRFEAGLIVLSTLSLTFMALIGQIFQTQAPMAQSLLLWWVLISPMLLLLGRNKASFVLWLGLTIATLSLNAPQQDWLILFITLFLAQAGLLLPIFPWWHAHKPGWTEPARRIGFITLIVITNIVFFTIPEMTRHHSLSWHGPILVNLALTAGFYFVTTQRRMILSRTDYTWLALTAGHFILLLMLYWLPAWFGWFVLYWLVAGYVGLRLDDRRIVTLAITAIALRVIILYFNLTHSLMATGLMMIFSGIGVIYIVKTYPRWRSFLIHGFSKQDTDQGDAP